MVHVLNLVPQKFLSNKTAEPAVIAGTRQCLRHKYKGIIFVKGVLLALKHTAGAQACTASACQSGLY